MKRIYQKNSYFLLTLGLLLEVLTCSQAFATGEAAVATPPAKRADLGQFMAKQNYAAAFRSLRDSKT